MTNIPFLDDITPTFPDTQLALDEPNGLLAAGGNLTIQTLLAAYRKGIFPWYSDGEPILWWSPSPRMVLLPEELHISRSLRKLAKKKPFIITVDTCFDNVICACANTSRQDQNGTWITQDIAEAFYNLHQQGHAHSIEAWQNGTLVGGLYGVCIGRAFFGESMFSHVSGASKVAFISLAQQLKLWDFKLIDCQIHTHYLASFGAKELPRAEFEKCLANANIMPTISNWQQYWSLEEHGFD